MNCFITGGNRGIGLEFAKQLSEKDWDIYVGCREPQKANKLKKIIPENNIILPDAFGLLIGFPGIINIPIEYKISDYIKNTFIGIKPGYYPDSMIDSDNNIVSAEIYFGRMITKYSSIRFLLGVKTYNAQENNVNYPYAGISLNTWPGNFSTSAISINFINLDIGLIFSDSGNIFGGPQLIASIGYKNNLYDK